VLAHGKAFFASSSGAEDDPSSIFARYAADPSDGQAFLSDLKRSVVDFVTSSFETCSCSDAEDCAVLEERKPLLGVEDKLLDDAVEHFLVDNTEYDIDNECLSGARAQKDDDPKINELKNKSNRLSSGVAPRTHELGDTGHVQSIGSSYSRDTRLKRSRVHRALGVKVEHTKLSHPELAAGRADGACQQKQKLNRMAMTRHAAGAKANAPIAAKLITSSRASQKNATIFERESSGSSVTKAKPSSAIAKATARPKRQPTRFQKGASISTPSKSSKSLSTVAPALVSAVGQECKRSL